MNNIVNLYLPEDPPICLQSDIAAGRPIYIYKYDKFLLYSNSIKTLLNHDNVIKPLRVCNSGISYLLRYGSIPSPQTIYKDVYVLSLGDICEVFTENKIIKLNFSNSYPFRSNGSQSKKLGSPDLNNFKGLIANAVKNCINPNKPTFLFHSAGKDSNMIAISLASIKDEINLKLVTLDSKHWLNESTISQGIAKKLNLQHSILTEEVGIWDTKKIERLAKYFELSPLPLTDYVGLLYPMYLDNMPELEESNIIDGGVNDVYMKWPVTNRNLLMNLISIPVLKMSFLRVIGQKFRIFSKVFRYPSERLFGSGLNLTDCRLIFPNYEDSGDYFLNESLKFKNETLLDFKTHMMAKYALSQHLLKAKNFSDVFGANLILPFMDRSVVDYIINLDEQYLIDKRKIRNKPWFRDILYKELGLNSDSVGKRGYSIDLSSMINNNKEYMDEQIKNCSFWNTNNVELWMRENGKILNKAKNKVKNIAELNYIRVFLLSAWLNKNKYIC